MLVRCAVVICVMPPASGPSSSSATCLPERARRYAVVTPAMPAPTTQTSTLRFSCRGGNSGSAAVAVQIDWLMTDLQQKTVPARKWGQNKFQDKTISAEAVGTSLIAISGNLL